MHGNNMNIGIRAKQMIIKNIHVCSIKSDTCYARTVRPNSIKANSEVVLQVKVARVKTGIQILLQPFANFVNVSILGAKCLVKVSAGRVMIRLAMQIFLTRIVN